MPARGVDRKLTIGGNCTDPRHTTQPALRQGYTDASRASARTRSLGSDSTQACQSGESSARMTQMSLYERYILSKPTLPAIYFGLALTGSSRISKFYFTIRRNECQHFVDGFAGRLLPSQSIDGISPGMVTQKNKYFKQFVTLR